MRRLERAARIDGRIRGAGPPNRAQGRDRRVDRVHQRRLRGRREEQCRRARPAQRVVDDLTLETPPFWTHAAQRDLAYFGLPGFYVPRPDFWTAPSWTYVYDTRPLLVTLGRHVDFAALNASPTAFAVTAVEVVTGALRAFVN